MGIQIHVNKKQTKQQTMEQVLSFLGGALSVCVAVAAINVFRLSSRIKVLKEAVDNLEDLSNSQFLGITEDLESLEERMDDCEAEDHDLVEERIDDLEERMDDCEESDDLNLLDISETFKSLKKLLKSKLK